MNTVNIILGIFTIIPVAMGLRLLWLIYADEYRAKKDSLPPKPPAPDDPYDAGIAAAKAGVEFWRNPHVLMSGSKEAYLRWSAGWCYGKQQEADQ